MNQSNRTQITVLEDHPVTILAQIRDLTTGNYITATGVTAIEFSVFDLESTTPETRVASGAVSVADTVFNFLQLDDRWNVDAIGYNFAHTQLASVFSMGSQTYALEYEFSTSAGVNTTFGLGFEVKVVNWRTS